MEDILNQVKKLSADELRTRLKEYGENVGPILPTTISLFQKRLARKILASQTTADSKPSVCDSESPVTVGNDRGRVSDAQGTRVESSKGASTADVTDDSTSGKNDDRTKTTDINLEASHFYGVSLPSSVQKEEIEGESIDCNE